MEFIDSFDKFVNEKILGIDLGSSKSVACVFLDGKPTMIPSADGNSSYSTTFPNYVAFTEDGELLVGQPAKDQAVENPENTISEIRRHMGTDYKVNIQGTEYTPQEISAMILQKIKRDAETFLGEPVTKAVITVPAYFDDDQRMATLDAGRIAGLNVLRLMNEPAAACLAYGIGIQDESNILIFDLGRGTLDITIMELDCGLLNVLSTSGNTALGGTDMDGVLIKYLADEFQKEHGIDLTQDMESMRILRKGAEKAKIELSNLPETTVKIPCIALGDDCSLLDLEEKITQAKFESLINPIVEKCGESIDQAFQGAGLTIDEIDKVILIGETARIQIIQNYVEKYIGKSIEKGIDPINCVAIGAAIYGRNSSSNFHDFGDPLHVLPVSLRYENPDGTTSIIFEKNSMLPVFKKQIFKTTHDNQKEFIVKLCMGENRIADLNTHLGSFVLDGIEPAKGGVEIEVTFEIDEDGILIVTATDKSTGTQKSITIASVNQMA